MKKLECCHYDTCLPDYFGGHHLPYLVLLPRKGMSLKDIKSELKSEANQGAYGGSLDYEIQESDIFHKRVIAAINRIKPAVKGQRAFFNDLDDLDEQGDDYDDCHDTVCAYFVFREVE